LFVTRCMFGETFQESQWGKITIYFVWINLSIFKRNTLKGQCHEIFSFRFFHESSSPKPLKITLGTFQNVWQKFVDIFASQGAPPVSTIANLAASTTDVDDTGGKFATSVKDTRGN
jgi:hypothetical protein